MGTATKHRVPAVICNFLHPGTLTLSPERQSARMSKITNDGLTLSGTGCFIAMATVGVKGLKYICLRLCAGGHKYYDNNTLFVHDFKASSGRRR